MAANYKPSLMTVNTGHTIQRLAGFAFKATSASVVNIRMTDVSGLILFPLSMAANESAAMLFPKSILTGGTVYVEQVSGGVTGTLYEG